MTFASSHDSVARLASSKRRMTSSSPKTLIKQICLSISFSDLATETEHLEKVLEAMRLSDEPQSAIASNMSWPCELGGGVSNSCGAATSDYGNIDGFTTCCAALIVAVIWWPSRRIRSWLFTAVASSSNTRRRVFLFNCARWKNRKGN